MSFDGSFAACAGDCVGFCGGEFAGDEVLLDFLEGLGFGEWGLGKGLVELLHHERGAGVADGPEGGEDGFGSTSEEVAADAGDFGAVLSCRAESSFAGAEDDEVGGGEVVEFGDVGDGEPIAVAEEEEGCGDAFGVEEPMGGDVEDSVVVEVS